MNDDPAAPGTPAPADAPPANAPDVITSLVAILWQQVPTSAEVQALSAAGSDLNAIVRAAVESPQFDAHYRRLKTSRSSASAMLTRDYAAVGLEPLSPDMPFQEAFAQVYLPRLGVRAPSMAAIFDALFARRGGDFMIVETGCLRVAGNWAGDGQSTFMFDHFATATNSVLFTIDINPYSVTTAREVCSSTVNVVLNDAVSALHALSKTRPGRPIDLLYLDSFDVDFADPVPSAKHHLKELCAAMPMLGPGSLICIDDCKIGDRPSGKGLFVNEFLSEIGATLLHDGDQVVWQLR